MEKKDLENISEFFSQQTVDAPQKPEEKWDRLFSDWVDKIESENKILLLFELKLWLESLEEFFASRYLEDFVLKASKTFSRSYDYYLLVFLNVINRLINLIKELNFKKDKYFINFEEFLVDRILSEKMEKNFPYFKELYAPENWFDNFRIFLSNFRGVIQELLNLEYISEKVYQTTKKLYHREILNNLILITLLNCRFIPKIDKIYQSDISQLILSTKEKGLKRMLGIYFVLAFQTLKINNFVEYHLEKSKFQDLVIPLILKMKISLERLNNFATNSLLKELQTHLLADDPKMKELQATFENFQLELKKVYDGELPLYFSNEVSKVKKRRILKNIIIIIESATQEMIVSVVRLFRDISPEQIFTNYVSRRDRALEIKRKLIRLHSKIDDFFVGKNKIAPSDVFFEINLFIEKDLNYLLYKDWNEFLMHYNNLNRSTFTSDFEPFLRSFHLFITRLIKDLIPEKEEV